MPRYAQIVVGPAGSGKSTYCNNMFRHCETLRRTVHVVNLDPAAEHFEYPVLVDIRDLISVEDVTQDPELHFGPNGGLIYCMEYFAQNLDWLFEELDDIEDDYILFDCPGQIELYTHIPVMRQLIEKLQGMNFFLCGVFLLDAQFMLEASKFVAGTMSALSTMVTMEIPHINVITKVDLLSKKDKQELERYLDPELETLLNEELGSENKKYGKLNHAIASVVSDFGMVRFLALDISDEESINDLLQQIDMNLQHGEDQEHQEPRENNEDDRDSGVDDFS